MIGAVCRCNVPSPQTCRFCEGIIPVSHQVTAACAEAVADERARTAPRLEALESALKKIDAVRNNIIAAQGVNWSRDIYPLVAALDEAGYPGEGYDAGRARMLEEAKRVAALEKVAEAAEAEKKRAAEAYISQGDIVIRLPIGNIQTAIDGAVSLGRMQSVRITDARAFARDVVNELNAEDEEGTTSIHEMFDEAFERAIENGSTAVEECDEDDEP